MILVNILLADSIEPKQRIGIQNEREVNMAMSIADTTASITYPDIPPDIRQYRYPQMSIFYFASTASHTFSSHYSLSIDCFEILADSTFYLMVS